MRGPSRNPLEAGRRGPRQCRAPTIQPSGRPAGTASRFGSSASLPAGGRARIQHHCASCRSPAEEIGQRLRRQQFRQARRPLCSQRKRARRAMRARLSARSRSSFTSCARSPPAVDPRHAHLGRFCRSGPSSRRGRCLRHVIASGRLVPMAMRCRIAARVRSWKLRAAAALVVVSVAVEKAMHRRCQPDRAPGARPLPPAEARWRPRPAAAREVPDRAHQAVAASIAAAGWRASAAAAPARRCAVGRHPVQHSPSAAAPRLVERAYAGRRAGRAFGGSEGRPARLVGEHFRWPRSFRGRRTSLTWPWARNCSASAPILRPMRACAPAPAPNRRSPSRPRRGAAERYCGIAVRVQEGARARIRIEKGLCRPSLSSARPTWQEPPVRPFDRHRKSGAHFGLLAGEESAVRPKPTAILVGDKVHACASKALARAQGVRMGACACQPAHCTGAPHQRADFTGVGLEDRLQLVGATQG